MNNERIISIETDSMIYHRERGRTEELITCSGCLIDRMKDTDSYHIAKAR